MSPDPILAEPSAYSYAAGNPVMMYDPSGMRTAYVRPSYTPLSAADRKARRRNAENRAAHEQERYRREQNREEFFWGDMSVDVAYDEWDDPVSYPGETGDGGGGSGNRNGGGAPIASDGYIPESAWPPGFDDGRGSFDNPVELDVNIQAVSQDPFPDDHQAWDVDDPANNTQEAGGTPKAILNGVKYGTQWLTNRMDPGFWRGTVRLVGGTADVSLKILSLYAAGRGKIGGVAGSAWALYRAQDTYDTYIFPMAADYTFWLYFGGGPLTLCIGCDPPEPIITQGRGM